MPPKTSLRRLRLRQLDETLKACKALGPTPRPRGGWIREIRQALGMTTGQLAERLGISQPSVVDMEGSERDEAISLASLRKAARALDAELIYAIVPRVPLEKMLHDQARRMANAEVRRVSHSMRLEDQGVSPEAEIAQVEELTEEILRRWPRSLWAR